MSALPSGTVSLLFSDIEGSTVLLSRLGSAYADALDAQRQVLRKAWATHGGTEMGTEGDSFFVVFPTAPAAVAAATQAQRELAAYPWPGGERVAVRIGVHTGNPTIHDGGYVGMDVHRAARIAAAAHGGEIVISDATAHLSADQLPAGAQLIDLGSHRLKDMAAPQQLFQVCVAGLRERFPPLKTLGAVSSLPTATTPLVGRDGELAELSDLLKSGDARLVTLTGPGGSGKTRLAVGVAQRLTETFPEGVYFVALAAVTASEVMWTTIAEALGLPPQGRIPPAFFDHVAHRTGLLVLDNLEQLPDADAVVAELLQGAPQLVILATSRRPLQLAGEYDHAVPPLELPDHAASNYNAITKAEASGAVQLFTQYAQMAKSTFRLTETNADAVVEVCRRLDGLPLAIELAAARVKLLSPTALLSRLDQMLDIGSSGAGRPTRQQTLRAAIDWSYDLLNPLQQTIFRSMGVFAGGADLPALAALTADILDGDEDPLDLVAELVDASLVTVSESTTGEPRIRLLETIRAYAYHQLTTAGELDAAHTAHTAHFVDLAAHLDQLCRGNQHLDARAQLQTEIDNFRQALTWTLQPSSDHQRISLGIRLARHLAGYWVASGHLTEGRSWLETAVNLSGERASADLAACLRYLAHTLDAQADHDHALPIGMQALAMARVEGDASDIASALDQVATTQSYLGDFDSARALFNEALALARESQDMHHVGLTLNNFGGLYYFQGDMRRTHDLVTEALSISQQIGDVESSTYNAANLIFPLALMGRVDEAHKQAVQLVPDVLRLQDVGLTINFAEDCAEVLARQGDSGAAARLRGAADAMRERNHLPRLHYQEEAYNNNLASRGDDVSPEEWERQYQYGRAELVENLLTQFSQT